MKIAINAAKAFLYSGAITIGALGGAHLGAQDVGHNPDKSPYRDIETPQRLTMFLSYLSLAKDPIGVTPHSAPMLGLRYEVSVAPPAQFYARLGYASAKRNAFNPTALPADRELGEKTLPMYFTDLGFAFNLTGGKSWNNIIPTAGFGLGVVMANKQEPNDPYKFGTQFTISTDLGIRYQLNNSFELRTSVGSMIYQTRFPLPYYSSGVAGNPLLTSSTKRRSYRNNWVFSAGASVPIFR